MGGLPGGGATGRFSIRIDTWVAPFLFLIGATRRRSTVTLTSDRLMVRLGFFGCTVERRRVVVARVVKGKWWYGIGVHTDFQGGVAINGSLGGVVEIDVDPPAPWRGLFYLPLKVSRLYVSFDEPDAFLSALGMPSSGTPGGRSGGSPDRP